MRELVFGYGVKYAAVLDLQSIIGCISFDECKLPPGCSKRLGSVGFQYDPFSNSFSILIEENLTCINRNAPPLFAELLRDGELRFLEHGNLLDFLESLQPMYHLQDMRESESMIG